MTVALPRRPRAAVGAALLVVAVVTLPRVVDRAVIEDIGGTLLSAPVPLALAMLAYAVAFGARAWAWTAVLPGLSLGQSWAALHVALLGNHVLPLRLGEALRVTSVLRRTGLSGPPVLASAVTLRTADLAAVGLLAAVTAPGLLVDLTGGGRGVVVTAGTVLLLAAGIAWSARLARRARLRLPGPTVAAAVVASWVLESAVVLAVARAAGLALSPGEAVAVTAVTIAAQTVAVTPGGFGSYEAAATAALVATGADASTAFGVALAAHATKTGYAVLTGGIALVTPAPGYWGRLRLPRTPPPRPTAWPVPDGAPVVVTIPAHNEEDMVGSVVRRVPETVAGRSTVVLVVDDGSTDATADRAAAAGAVVVRHPHNLGLGAALRRGLAEASARQPAAVVYLDADGEYFPEDMEALVSPVLRGEADYVVGSRFTGRIGRMLPHRRLGNRLLTRWLRWLTRRHLSDGQSGYRAFSRLAAAHAEVAHDYNYAQVLTLDLLGKGYRYQEVPIRYTFREKGTSFVRLGTYLRKVLPAVHRELNSPVPSPPQYRSDQPGSGWGGGLAAAASSTGISHQTVLPCE